MSKKEEKEFKRRVGKMQKHVEALRELTLGERERNVLDEIEAQLAFLRGDHPSQKAASDPANDQRGIAN